MMEIEMVKFVKCIMVFAFLCSSPNSISFADGVTGLGAGGIFFTRHEEDGSDRVKWDVYVNIVPEVGDSNWHFRLKAVIDGAEYFSEDVVTGNYDIELRVIHALDHPVTVTLQRNRRIFEGWKDLESVSHTGHCYQ
jgi:hypothetical protein